MNGGTPWLGTDDQDDDGERGAEQQRVEAPDPQLEALGRALRQELQPDHDGDREHDRPKRRRLAGREQRRDEVGELVEVLRAEEDPAEYDEVEDDEPAEPAGQPSEPSVQPVFGREPRPVEGPQRTKLKAPCQRPPSVIVTIRLT